VQPALETEPLELLFERSGLPHFGLPPSLSAIYGGDLGFSTPRLFANFVSSIDGVVALPTGGESGHVVSGGRPCIVLTPSDDLLNEQRYPVLVVGPLLQAERIWAGCTRCCLRTPVG
jgi:hypothetical protein